MLLRFALLLAELSQNQPRVEIQAHINGVNRIVVQYSAEAANIINTLLIQMQDRLN